MYVPDRVFMKRLREQDRKLGCHFNGEHFVITYEVPWGPPAVIWVVKRDDGGFRQPDQRDLDEIMNSSIERESPEEKHQRAASYMKDYRLRQALNRKDTLRQLTKENKTQLMRAFSKVDGELETWRVGQKPQRAITVAEQMFSR